MNNVNNDCSLLLEYIINKCNKPKLTDSNHSIFQTIKTTSNDYYGKIGVGKIYSSKISLNDKLNLFDINKKNIVSNKVTKLFKQFGLETYEVNKLNSGDIG